MADKRITSVDFVESLNSDESFFINQNNAIKQINKNNVVFGVTNGGTGAKTAKEARANLGAISVFNTVAYLPADNWNDNSQTINISDIARDIEVDENSVIFISPVMSNDNYEAYAECGVRCAEQEQGYETLTFLCDYVPKIIIAVNVVIFY